MNDALNDASTPSTSSATPASDPDLIEQARPGHGVPSQDPDPGAQYPIDPEHAREEEKTVYMRGGVLAGVATGAAIGTAVGGPVGTVVGGTIGAVAGAIGGAAAGSITQTPPLEAEAEAEAEAAPAPTSRS